MVFNITCYKLAPSVLQCVAVCCSVVQCVAVWCSVVQCVAMCCSVLQCVAVSYHTVCNCLTNSTSPVTSSNLASVREYKVEYIYIHI